MKFGSLGGLLYAIFLVGCLVAAIWLESAYYNKGVDWVVLGLPVHRWPAAVAAITLLPMMYFGSKSAAGEAAEEDEIDAF